MPSDSISFPVRIGFLLAALLAAFFSSTGRIRPRG